MWPIHDGTYETFQMDREPYWERQVDLRILPTAAVVAGVVALQRGASLPVAALVFAVPMLAARSIWPLTGGPFIPIYRAVVDPPSGETKS